MKYFNKRYDALITVCEHLNEVENDERTGSFNEAVYYEIYNDQLEIFLNMLMEDCRKFNDRYDEDEAKEEFRKSQTDILKLLKEYIPDSVKEKIPDLRILALGFATREVMAEIDDYIDEIQDEIDKTDNEYEKHCHSIEKSIPKSRHSLFEIFYQFVNLAKTEDDDFIIEFDTEVSIDINIKRLTFKNFAFEKQDEDLNNSMIKFSEVYFSDGRYTLKLYVLNNSEPAEIVISADDIIIGKIKD